jgi:hypothetical protein
MWHAADMLIVEVKPDPRGRWGVALSGPGAGTSCETLEDARRLAYAKAAQRLPCELVVQDAYHRVIERRRFSAASKPRDGRAPARPAA